MKVRHIFLENVSHAEFALFSNSWLNYQSKFIHCAMIVSSFRCLPCFLLNFRLKNRAMNYEEMLFDSECSESDYEVIIVNPNINYESEDDSGMEDYSNCAMQEVETETIEINAEFNQEVEVKDVGLIVKAEEEVSRDSIAPTVEDENSMSSNDSMNCPKKVRKKLNLAEYKIRRANEIPQKPLFDVPRKVAAFELCDTPATLPLLILPTDPSWIKHNQQGLKQEADNLSKSSAQAFNPSHYEEITILSMGCILKLRYHQTTNQPTTTTSS